MKYRVCTGCGSMWDDTCAVCPRVHCRQALRLPTPQELSSFLGCIAEGEALGTANVNPSEAETHAGGKA